MPALRSCCAYLMILGDCFSPLLKAAAGDVWWAERDAVIAGVGTLVVLPLCFPRSLDAISGVRFVYWLCIGGWVRACGVISYCVERLLRV